MYEKKKNKNLLVLGKNNIKKPNKNLILNTEQLELNNQEEINKSNNEKKVISIFNKFNENKIEKRAKTIRINNEILKNLKNIEKKEDLEKRSIQKKTQNKKSKQEKSEPVEDNFNVIRLHTRDSFFIPNQNQNQNVIRNNQPTIMKRNTLALKPRPKNSGAQVKIENEGNFNPVPKRNPDTYKNLLNRRQLTLNFSKFVLSAQNTKKFGSEQQKKSETKISDDLGISSLIMNNKIHYMKKIKEKDIDVNKYVHSIFFLKDPILKKKDNLFKKIRKYSLIQSIFSAISVILCAIDMELYNIFSEQYIIENNIQYNEYYKIRYRTISSTENTIRILNFLCCLITVAMTLCIYLTKIVFNKTEEAKLLKHKNNVQNILILYELSNSHLKGHRNYISFNTKVKLIIRLLINIFFYPPTLNYCFKSSFNNVIYLFPFQIFALILSTFKIYNIYRTIFYFIPYTGNLGEDTCQKYNIRFNFKFIFRGFLYKNRLFFAIIIIIISLVTLLLHSIEFFSVDLSLINDSTEIYIDVNNHNMTHNFNPNFYLDILWLYLSTLPQHSLGDYIPKTPIGKIVFFFFHIIGFLFLCIIYLRMDKIINLDSNGLKAYTKLIKLFKPENKENKAADLIKSFILVNKYYSLYNVDINQVRENFKEIRRSTNFDGNEIRKIMKKKISKMKNKKIIFFISKFIFFSKFHIEVKNFLDIYNISRKQPMGVDALIQSIQDKMSKNYESLNDKLTYLSYIDNIYARLNHNDYQLLKKMTKIKKYEESIISYLIERSNINYQKNKNKENKQNKENKEKKLTMLHKNEFEFRRSFTRNVENVEISNKINQ